MVKGDKTDDTSKFSSGAGERTFGTETTVQVTPESERTQSNTERFSESKQVQQGEWNPDTHGQPPDQRPKTDF